MLKMREPAGDVRSIHSERAAILTDRKELKRAIHTTGGGFGTAAL
jgi:hypothetical protein